MNGFFKRNSEIQIERLSRIVSEQKRATEKSEAQALFTAIMTDTVLDDEDNEEEQ